MLSVTLRRQLLEEESRECERLMRRNIRDNSNPLDMPETLFVQHFRVNKATFSYLLDELTSSIPRAQKSFAAPPIVKLAACLRFFAEGAYQKGVGRDREVGLAQSTFSKVLSEVLVTFEAKLCRKWVFWPNEEECRTIAANFYEKFKIPGVFGCIDGTHVCLVAPEKNAHLYYNRKGQYSLNVMLVCDDQCKIRYVDATHPGASHDSVIWTTSICRNHLESLCGSGVRNLWLLGDCGYPLEPWLMTPYRNAQQGTNEFKFNAVHAQCRNIVERTNGILKNRWRCILGARQLHYQPLKAVQIINVCAALHNICIHFKSAYQPSVDCQTIGANDQEHTNTFDDERLSRVAQRIRADISNSL